MLNGAFTMVAKEGVAVVSVFVVRSTLETPDENSPSFPGFLKKTPPFFRTTLVVCWFFNSHPLLSLLFLFLFLFCSVLDLVELTFRGAGLVLNYCLGVSHRLSVCA